MRVEVLKAFGSYSVGSIIPEMPGNVARSMIGRGMVREIDPPAPSYRGGNIESPENRMMRAAGREPGTEKSSAAAPEQVSAHAESIPPHAHARPARRRS